MAGRFFALVFSVFLIAAVLGSRTGASNPEATAKPATDYASFIDSLRREGAAVEELGEIGQSFFSVEGRVARVRGEDVQVFEYADEVKADEQVKLISPDGSAVGTSSIFWMAPPHFFITGKIIILYTGQNIQIIGLLKKYWGLNLLAVRWYSQMLS